MRGNSEKVEARRLRQRRTEGGPKSRNAETGPLMEARLRHVEQQLRGRQVPIVLEDPRLDREGQMWLIDKTWNQESTSITLPERVIPWGTHIAWHQWMHSYIAYPAGIPALDTDWTLWWIACGDTYVTAQIGHRGPVISGDWLQELVSWTYLRFPISLPAHAYVVSARLTLYAQKIGGVSPYVVRPGNNALVYLLDWDDARPSAPHDWHHPTHNYKAWSDLGQTYKAYPWDPADEDPYPNIPVCGTPIKWDCGGTYTYQQPFYSCDLSPLVQAFIRRPGYVAGNYMGLRVGGEYGTRWTKSIASDQQIINALFDEDHPEFFPVLDVTYGFGPEIRCQVGGRKRAMLMGVA